MRSLFAVEPDDEAFKAVLENTLTVLREDAERQPALYRSLGGSRLEGKVYEVLCRVTRETVFEGTVEWIAGQRFPDIVVGGYYGVEVKTTHSEHWRSTGSSVAEGTRVEGVERIYMLFGKLSDPIGFRCKPYGACLSEVVVTHSPRYAIDMDLAPGGTFFDKLGMSYDDLRREENPIRTVVRYYRSRLKEGEQVWWLDGEQSTGASMVVRMWRALSVAEQEAYRVKGFAFFPEILGEKQNKYQRFTLWLATHEGVVCPNARDHYSASGQVPIRVGERLYDGMPRVFFTLQSCLKRLKRLVENTPTEVLMEFWEGELGKTKEMEKIGEGEDEKWRRWQKLALRYCRTRCRADFPVEIFLGMEGN